MAVLGAVRSWEAHAGLPPINAEGDDESAQDAAGISKNMIDEEVEEGMWSAERLERELNKLLRIDHPSLLLEHESVVGQHSSQSIGKS